MNGFDEQENDYVRLVKRAAPVIRAEDPDARIVVGSVSGMFYPGSREWLYALLGSEAMPLVDVITWHPFYSESPAVKRTRGYCRRYPSIVARIKRRAEANGFRGQYDQYRFVTPEQYRPWEWRWRSLLDTDPDVHFAWHSDTPPMGDADPMRHIHGFVTRREIRPDGTVCEPPDWAIDDVLTVEEALRLMTIDGAYAILREDELGSLEPGKLADLVILSHDPIDVAPDDILGIEVLMTMVGGRAQHCTEDYEPLCG